jgi:hypothetical protein
MQTLAAVLPLYTEHHNETISEVFHSSEGISPMLSTFETKKNKDGAGRNYIQRVQYSVGAVASGTFATTQAKAQGTSTGSGPGQTRFEIPAVTVHGMGVVTRDAIDAVEGGDADEVFDVLDNSIKLGSLDVRNQLAAQACERGWGRVGTITAVDTTTITINPSLVNRIEIGDDLVVATAESGVATKNSNLSIAVTAINSDTGVITMASDPTVATAWAINDVVFRKGNRESTPGTTKLAISGARAWLDHTTASDVLFGVTRTGIEKLTGYRISGLDLTRAQALLKAATKLHKFGSGNASICFISDEDFFELAADKDVQKNIEIKLGGEYEIGFTGIGVLGPNGKMIKCVADSYLEQGFAYMGPWDSAKERPFLFYNGPALINIDDKDGNTMLRLPGSTSYEIRLYFRGNAVMPAPGKFAVIYNFGATS